MKGGGTESMSIAVDVIIPVYRPDEKLRNLLGALAGQSMPVRYIFLMHTEDGIDLKDYCPVDRGMYLCRNIPEDQERTGGIPVCEIPVRRDDFDHAGTRNLGAAGCLDSDFMLFMTQDAVPENARLIAELYAPFKDWEENRGKIRPAVAYARQVTDAGASEAERYSRTLNYGETSRMKTEQDKAELGIRTYFCSDVCAMYDRKIFESLGGFIKSAVFNEDMIYAAGALKHGYGVYYASEACVVHYHEYSAMQQFRRNFDLGASQAMAPQVFSDLSSEGTGVGYALSMVKHLMISGRPVEVPVFLWRCVFRLAGYRLGKKYRGLSDRMIMRCTSNSAFWKKYLKGKAR